MKLIVGLGNPGKKYEKTRHNIGWTVLDMLKDRLVPDVTFSSDSKFEADIVEFKSDDERIIFAKPTTYMNNSGRSVFRLMQYFKLEPLEIVVIHDELDLPIGTIRTQTGGSSAGHNGIASIIHNLGTESFHRVRIGISTDKMKNDATDYVLSDYSATDLKNVIEMIDDLESILLNFFSSDTFKETTLTNN